MSRDNLYSKRQAYDQAQKVGERVEVMASSKGWTTHFIPKIQKLRDEAQAIVNSPDSSQQETDVNRGLLIGYDIVLGYTEETMKNQRAIMHKNSISKLAD